MKRIPILYRLLLFFIITSGTAAPQENDQININCVITENGMISGLPGADSKVKVFRGIPYSAPPLGEFRWKDPQPVQNWEGIRKCEAFGPNAMQNKPIPSGLYTGEFLIPLNSAISEDCLYLNVWTAAEKTGEKRPVIVFLHGGAFISGSGSVPIYDGEAMAAKGVVFITFNYRLGVFGFFAHPELTKESGRKASGNYGILDQIAALKWIRKNIAAFGGDPDNVTIAGQSAGAVSVNVLCASPLAQGLFHKMIAGSGSSVMKGVFGVNGTLKEAEEKGREIGASLKAYNIDDLRAKTEQELLSAFSGLGSVIVDGYVLPESIPSLFARQSFTDVPLLTGWNADDAFFFAPANLDGYKKYLTGVFGADAEKIHRLYPAATDQDSKKAHENLVRDMSFAVRNYAWARIQSSKKNCKVYMYFFQRQLPDGGGISKFGAFHSGEIVYAYNNLKKLNRPWESADYKLADMMSSCWVNFALKGNPNGEGLPFWPQFNKDKGEVMIFDVKSAASKHPCYDGLEYLFSRE